MEEIRLTWFDIFMDPAAVDLAELLGLWPNTVSGLLLPIGASVFGDIYFQRQSGEIERLDVLEGGVHEVAKSHAEFAALMNTASWQEESLLTQGIALLYERGIKRGAGQFYAFVPHPAFAGKIHWDRVMPMDARVWHSICSQILDGGVTFTSGSGSTDAPR